MSEQGDRTNNGGKPGCDYDLVLAAKVMSMIKQYHQDEDIAPEPLNLRNTMLAIAALLHLESLDYDREDARETFAEIARAQLDEIMQVEFVAGKIPCN
jgi:hypothetical protein